MTQREQRARQEQKLLDLFRMIQDEAAREKVLDITEAAAEYFRNTTPAPIINIESLRKRKDAK